jgi:hypothetical protein
MAKKKKGLSSFSKIRRKASTLMSRKKADKSSYKAPKKRTGANAAAKSMAERTAAGTKRGTGSTLKTKAKQKMLNAKGKSKALIRNAKAGKYVMTADHRKAISEGLKKRFGFGSKKK